MPTFKQLKDRELEFQKKSVTPELNTKVGSIPSQGDTSSNRYVEEDNLIKEVLDTAKTNTALNDTVENTKHLPGEDMVNPYYQPDKEDTDTTEDDTNIYLTKQEKLDYLRSLQKNQGKTYLKAFSEFAKKNALGEDYPNAPLVESIQKVASEVSPHYKKYGNTDKCTFNNEDWKRLATEFQANIASYGIETATENLNKAIQNNIAENLNWVEQNLGKGFIGAGAVTAGELIQMAGALEGIGEYLFTDAGENKDLNKWDNFINTMMDNDVTRYGKKVAQYGTLNSSKLKEMEENNLLGNFEIVNYTDTENDFFNANTLGTLLQQGGFTAASMFAGMGEAKIAGWAFKGLTSGATKGLTLAKGVNDVNKLTKLNKALTNLKQLQKASDKYLIPGLSGTSEGLINGLETKLNVKEKGEQIAYQKQQQLVNDKVQSIIKKSGRKFTPEEVQNLYYQVWAENRDKYDMSLRQVERDATYAGINDFYINSAINGLLNSSLKAGLQAQRVRSALQDSKIFGKLLKPKPEFNISGSGINTIVTPKTSYYKTVLNCLKEPAGEALEEYTQNLSSEATSAGALNNINAWIEKKYNGDSALVVGEDVSSNIGAAWTALTNALVSKESIQSALYGALGSMLGTIGLARRTVKMDENGNIVYNYAKDKNGNLIKDTNGNPIKLGPQKTFLERGLNQYTGERESYLDMLKRVTPWRSGISAALNEDKKQNSDNLKIAESIQDWLRDPTNKSKFDGLVGTASWAAAMNDASAFTDEFGYRNSALGKTINDAFMLEKLKGTQYYNDYMNQIVEMANLESDSPEATDAIKAFRDNVNNDYSNLSDSELLSLIKNNASTLLSTIEDINKTSEDIDSVLGNVDEDTKQSLVFSRLQIKDWDNRQKQLEKEIGSIEISNSVDNNTASSSDVQKIIAQYGSLEKAQKRSYQLEQQKSDLTKDISNLKNKKELMPKEKELLDSKKRKLKTIEKELKTLDKEFSNVENSVLSENDIMALDPSTRAMMLLQGQRKTYSSIHGDNEKRKTLADTIFDLENQKESLMQDKFKAKKHKFKQVQKIEEQITKLKKELDHIVTTDETPFYSEPQQQIINNLVQQGSVVDAKFLDKVIDLGRIEASKKAYLQQYNNILADPNSYNRYVNSVKQRVMDAAIGRKYDNLNKLSETDKKQFEAELDQLLYSGNEREFALINNKFRREGNAKYKDYIIGKEAIKKFEERLMLSNKVKQLDSNDVDLLLVLANYISNSNSNVFINPTPKEIDAVINNAIENKEEIEQYVEGINSKLPLQEQIVFSFAESLSNLKDILNEFADVKNNEAKLTKETTPTITNEDNNKPIHTESPKVESKPVETPELKSPESKDISAAGMVKTAIESITKKEEAKGDTASTSNNDEGPYNFILDSYANNTTLVPYAKVAINVLNNADAQVYTEQMKNDVATIINNLGTTQMSVDNYIAIINSKATGKDQEDKNEEASLLRMISSRISNIEKTTDKTSIFDKLRTTSVNPNAAMLNTLDMSYIRSKYPDGHLIKYYDSYKIDEYLKNNHDTLNSKSVFFMYDSVFNNAIKESLGDKYNDNQIGIVAVVEDENGPIEIDNKKYQPIGIMPATHSPYNSGSSRMEFIRKSIVNKDGMEIIKNSNGQPIKTNTFGKHGGVMANVSSNNSSSEDIPILDIQLSNEINSQETGELAGLSKSEKRKTPIYKKLRDAFISKLKIQVFPNSTTKGIAYMQDNLKGGTNPLFCRVLPIHKTKSLNNDNTIDAFANNPQEFLQFNNKIRRASSAIQKELLDTFNAIESITLNRTNRGISTTGDCKTAIAGMQNALLKNMRYYLNIPAEYEIVLVPTEEINEGQNVFNIVLKNTNNTTKNISLGAIYKGIDAETLQFNVLKNLILDESNKVRLQENGIDSFIKWQVNFNDVSSKDSNQYAKSSVEETYDDNILTVKNSTLTYQIQGVSLNSPFSNTGEIVTIPTSVSNASNATSTPSMNTPVVNESQVLTPTNGIVESNSGAVLQEPKSSPQSTSMKRVKQTIDKIIEDSKQYEITENEDFYKNTVTGKIRGRVTKILEADKLGSPFEKDNPWILPSTNIGTGIDEFVRDFFEGKLNELSVAQLEEKYPNTSGEQLMSFKNELQNKLMPLFESQGITIIPKGIKAVGSLKVTDTEGKEHTIDLAGTVDLLGYDAQGKFHLYDMKTLHNNSQQSKQAKSHKWGLQLSLYKKFLEDTYGIQIEDTHIIPIPVTYPSPEVITYELSNPEMQKEKTNTNRCQLKVNGKDYKNASPKLDDLIPIKDTPLEIVWSKLTPYYNQMEQLIEAQSTANNGENTSKEQITIDSVEMDKPTESPVDPLLGVSFDMGEINSLWGDETPVTTNSTDIIDITPQELRWNNLSEDTRTKLSGKSINEAVWEKMPTEAKKHEFKCLNLPLSISWM